MVVDVRAQARTLQPKPVPSKLSQRRSSTVFDKPVPYPFELRARVYLRRRRNFRLGYEYNFVYVEIQCDNFRGSQSISKPCPSGLGYDLSPRRIACISFPSLNARAAIGPFGFPLPLNLAQLPAAVRGGGEMALKTLPVSHAEQCSSMRLQIAAGINFAPVRWRTQKKWQRICSPSHAERSSAKA